MIDKLDPTDFKSTLGSQYLGNVDETIEEEHSDDYDHQANESSLSSHSSNRHGRRSRFFTDAINPLSIWFVRDKNQRQSRSLISPIEQDAIAEELEEYDFQPPPLSSIDERYHCFKVPCRDSAQKSIDSQASESDEKQQTFSDSSNEKQRGLSTIIKYQ
jgi:hypothetical protein